MRFRALILFLVLFTFSIYGLSAENLKKSSAKAFFLSLLVPGAGQYYAGNSSTSAIYFGAELLLIGGYMYYSSESDNMINKYKNYADTHFYYQGDDPDRQSYYDMWPILVERVYAKTALPRDKVGEYWELIGKLPELTVFWDKPEQQKFYYDMRQEANQDYKNANKMLGLIAINHVVSAVDALLSVKKYNTRLSSSFYEGELKVGITTTF